MYNNVETSGKYLIENQLYYLLPTTNKTKRAFQSIVDNMETDKENHNMNSCEKEGSKILNLFYSLLK